MEPINKTLFRSALIVFLVSVLILSSCGPDGETGEPGLRTWTPTPSYTPTCESGISLSTPEGWDTTTTLYVVLFDQNSIGSGKLEYGDGSETVDTLEYIKRLLPKIMGPRDQASVFRLGVKNFENAKIGEVSSLITKPQLYSPPTPHGTLTPLPTLGTLVPGLEGIATSNAQRKALTLQATEELELHQKDNCAQIEWDFSAKLTATAWVITEQAEATTIAIEFDEQSTEFAEIFEAQETPYAENVVYDGLSHATRDLHSQVDQGVDCSNFDRCILIIFDSLESWGFDNPNNLEIDLSGVQVLSIMANCRDIDQPSCKDNIQLYWKNEFVKFGAESVEFLNGDRLETKLFDYLKEN